jgi:hypothetical protein
MQSEAATWLIVRRRRLFADEEIIEVYGSQVALSQRAENLSYLRDAQG